MSLSSIDPLIVSVGGSVKSSTSAPDPWSIVTSTHLRSRAARWMASVLARFIRQVQPSGRLLWTSSRTVAVSNRGLLTQKPLAIEPLLAVGARLRWPMLLSNGTRSACDTTADAGRSWVTAWSAAFSAMANTHSWPTWLGVQGNGPNTYAPPAGMSLTDSDGVSFGVQSVGHTRPIVGSEWYAFTVTEPAPVVPLFLTRTYR